MDIAQLALIGVGTITLVVSVVRARGPLAAIGRLDQAAANLDRYDTWRGNRTAIEADGPTGADEMRAQMRRRVMSWVAVGVAGVVAIVVGLFIL